jgi:heterotetrameric sarcosine oxidase gamma subunit
VPRALQAPSMSQEGSDRFERPGLLLEPSPPRRKLLLLGDVTAARGMLAEVISLPKRTNQVTRTKGVGVCLRLRPDQCLMLLAGETEAARVREQLRHSAQAELYVLDASARFVGFSMAGVAAAALLNSGCSLDLRLRSMPVDTCAGTRIEQVPVWIAREQPEAFEVWVERPLTPYLWQWLLRAAEAV